MLDEQHCAHVREELACLARQVDAGGLVERVLGHQQRELLSGFLQLRGEPQRVGRRVGALGPKAANMEGTTKVERQ